MGFHLIQSGSAKVHRDRINISQARYEGELLYPTPLQHDEAR
jgi:hypothetical protein